jgi:hypothetical protein
VFERAARTEDADEGEFEANFGAPFDAGFDDEFDAEFSLLAIFHGVASRGARYPGYNWPHGGMLFCVAVSTRFSPDNA